MLKARLSITDEFLWDLYNLFNTVGGAARSTFKYPTMSNSLPGIENPIFEKIRKAQGARKFGKLIYYLKKNGYIKVKNLESRNGILLTKKGVGKALRASFKLDKKKRKDGKWIMLTFDMPQKQKKQRSLLTSILHNSGYKMFQQSVWITPYDVLKKTEQLIQMYSLDIYVKIFLIEKI